MSDRRQIFLRLELDDDVSGAYETTSDGETVVEFLRSRFGDDLDFMPTKSPFDGSEFWSLFGAVLYVEKNNVA